MVHGELQDANSTSRMLCPSLSELMEYVRQTRANLHVVGVLPETSLKYACTSLCFMSFDMLVMSPFLQHGKAKYVPLLCCWSKPNQMLLNLYVL